jgi:hypothetical protein
MRDTIITAKAKKKELLIFTACLIVALILNIYAIITISNKWTEIYTSLHYVFIVALTIYVFISVIRLIIYGLTQLIHRYKKNQI